MKKILMICVVSILSITLYGQGIKFENISIEAAIVKAKEQNKLVFIDAYTVWCSPCKWMEQNVFPDKEVGRFFNDHFVALSIDTEKKDGARIKEMYNVNGLPGYAFINGDGEIIYKNSGRKEKEEFMTMCKKAIESSKDVNNIARLKAQYPLKKTDEQFMLLYLDKMLAANESYADEFDYFLKHTSVKHDSKEMVDLLYKHSAQIIYESEAIKIIKANFYTETWRDYIRKDMREMFKMLSPSLPVQSMKYAVANKNEKYIETIIKRAQESGMKMDNARVKGVYLDYYTKTNNSEGIKRIIKEVMGEICTATDFAKLKKEHAEIQLLPNKNLFTTKAMNLSRAIIDYAKLYSQHTNNEDDKKTILSWIDLSLGLEVENSYTLNAAANIIYKFGDKKKAIDLKQKAITLPESKELYKEELGKMLNNQSL